MEEVQLVVRLVQDLQVALASEPTAGTLEQLVMRAIQVVLALVLALVDLVEAGPMVIQELQVI